MQILVEVEQEMRSGANHGNRGENHSRVVTTRSRLHKIVSPKLASHLLLSVGLSD